MTKVSDWMFDDLIIDIYRDIAKDFIYGNDDMRAKLDFVRTYKTDDEILSYMRTKWDVDYADLEDD